MHPPFNWSSRPERSLRAPDACRSRGSAQRCGPAKSFTESRKTHDGSGFLFRRACRPGADGAGHWARTDQLLNPHASPTNDHPAAPHSASDPTGVRGPAGRVCRPTASCQSATECAPIQPSSVGVPGAKHSSGNPRRKLRLRHPPRWTRRHPTLMGASTQDVWVFKFTRATALDDSLHHTRRGVSA